MRHNSTTAFTLSDLDDWTYQVSGGILKSSLLSVLVLCLMLLQEARRPRIHMLMLAAQPVDRL
jgi:hypothetical protein